MVKIAPDARLTVEAFARWPNRRLYELVDGRPVERATTPRAAAVASTVVQLLHEAVRRTGEARVFPGGLAYACYRHRPATVRRPSVTVVRRDRLAGVRGDPEFMPVAPDLAVEVACPGGGPALPRVADHLSAGARAVWVVRLNDRSVTVHRPDGSADTLVPGQHVTADPVLTGFRCDVADLFA